MKKRQKNKYNYDAPFPNEYLIMIPVIDLKQKIKEIGGKPYSPVDVARGVEHCTKSIKPSYVLLFEPYKVNTRGDYSNRKCV